ncbi:hypothetical protein AB3S75_036270 [Citrus x aurantiifolia]
MRVVSMSLSGKFPAVKNRNPNPSKLSSSSSSATPIRSQSQSKRTPNSNSRSWSVYLIISTNPPIKTYVGTTTNFPRRLKQHNGELRGGAKASQAGRPWISACIIQGFHDQSDACEFESKWKCISRRLPRKMKKSEDSSLHLLQHRQTALNRVKEVCNCSHLQIDWKLNPL